MKNAKKQLSLELIEAKNEPYYLIEKQEIVSGIRLSSENAKTLYDSALQIETNNNIGLANSLLILAAEESIKTFILSGILINVPYTFPIEHIFRQHLAKHGQGKEINKVIEITHLVLQTFPYKRNKTNNSFVRIIKDAIDITNKAQWWELANDDKNRGLYVDLENGKFIAPSAYSKERYEVSKRIVSKYVGLVEIFGKSEAKFFDQLIDLGNKFNLRNHLKS